jgi:pimeloyl-ACP methyl ester carboxylesterase
MGKHIDYSLFRLFLLSAICLLISAQASADISTKELVELESRPGVTQQFILLSPEQPAASIILIGGGPGNYGMYESFGSPSAKNGKNFLVRTRENFAKEGLAVAVVDICSDMKKSKKGMTVKWRLSEKHLKDIQAIALFMKNKYALPVWVIGTSRGTWSTLNIAINDSKNISGIILTSSITRRPKAASFKRGILDMDLDKVTLPTLIVAHENDKCFFSPPEDAGAIKDKLTNSPVVETKLFSGGKKPKTAECKPLSQHGFYGIENEVVGYISEFVKFN